MLVDIFHARANALHQGIRADLPAGLAVDAGDEVRPARGAMERHHRPLREAEENQIVFGEAARRQRIAEEPRPDRKSVV